MNWVILVWGMIASACLTLGLVHLLAWIKNQRAKASLAFSVAATSVAACAACELGMMLSTTPQQINDYLGYGGLTIIGLNAGLIAYVCLEFGTGNCWLGGSSLALRLLAAIISLTVSGNDIYREVTAVGTIELLGTQVSIVTGAISSPLVHLGTLSSLLWVIFMFDASVRLWRRGGSENRRRAGVVGGGIILFLLLAAGISALQEYHIIRSPYFISLSFLPIILVIAYEMGRSLIQAAVLADDLRESKAALSLAAESAGAGLWAIDSDRKCLWLTDRARQLYGFSQREVPDLERMRKIWHPDDRERLEKALMESLSIGAEFQEEYRVADGNGGIRWLSSRGRPYSGKHAEPDRLMGATIDISARKHAAEEVLRHNRELTHMSRVSLVGELSGALVHDLGQPLGAVLANAETARILLDAAEPDCDELHAILADIQDDSVRAGQIIHGMRTFLKRQEIEFHPLDMARLFAEVEKLAHPDAILRRTTLTFHTAPGLPQVRGHRVQMQQVILNLILNGLQAMEDCPPGERTLHVAAAIDDGGQLHVSVKDRGYGLPDGKLDQVFTPFLTTKDTGLGMGLAICRRIIQAHGGRIWIENNAGPGATVHITLPIPAGE